MNRTEQNLLQALQKSLWEADIAIPDDTDWDAVIEEARRQAVLSVVIAAAPKQIQDQRKSQASIGTAVFIRNLHYQNQLYLLLKENGIPMVILKGTAAAVYYDKPYQRTMGDIDFLVPREYFDSAKEILAQNGYTIEEDPRYQRHIDVLIDQICFEMHRYFSDENVNIEKYVIEGLKNIELYSIYGIEFPALPKLANGLVLLAHLVHHMQDGLGLRQIIDWMLYVDKELNDSFWEESFGAAARDTGLETVAIVATEMCRMYLGLKADINWCKTADPQTCTELLENVFLSGNFNTKQGTGSLVETTVTNLKRQGFFSYLQTAGEHNWKAYHRHRWLKPFCRFYQIGRYARQGLRTKRSGKQILQDIERGNKRIELLKKLNIKTVD